MQNTSGQVGLVQWIMPARPRRLPDRYKHNKSINSDSDMKSLNSDDTVFPDSAKSTLPDLSLLRTISAFIQGHLRELAEHQQSINKARANITNANVRQCPQASRLDITKLKVRDEQTKAIETIKQLTNYFRELTHLMKECDAYKEKSDVETTNKLSDLRTEIIQALNDFVLANSDIDLPILDLDDGDYDYCIGARAAMFERDIALPIEHSFEHSDQHTNVNEGLSQQLVKRIDDQSIGLEKRRREIQKLERDTEELKRLFSDFYILVKAQGEQVDSIENNIVITHHCMSEGHRHVNRAMKSLTIIMPVTGCMAGALIGGPLGLVLGGKMGGITVGCVTSLLGLLSSYSAQRCMQIK